MRQSIVSSRWEIRFKFSFFVAQPFTPGDKAVKQIRSFPSHKWGGIKGGVGPHANLSPNPSPQSGEGKRLFRNPVPRRERLGYTKDS